jgi:hypothetical protein
MTPEGLVAIAAGLLIGVAIPEMSGWTKGTIRFAVERERRRDEVGMALRIHPNGRREPYTPQGWGRWRYHGRTITDVRQIKHLDIPPGGIHLTPEADYLNRHAAEDHSLLSSIGLADFTGARRRAYPMGEQTTAAPDDLGMLARGR